MAKIPLSARVEVACLLHRRFRERHRKRRALAEARTRGRDAPAMQFDHVFHDVQSQPEARIDPQRPLILREPFEYAWQKFRRNADSRVADAKPDRADAV